MTWGAFPQIRKIPGHEGYMVSSCGKVLSGRGKKGSPLRDLNPVLNQSGYPTVTIRRDDGTYRTCRVHQLVAEAFIGPRPDGMQVRHLDGNSANPSLNNLRYGTPTENQQDRWAHGTMLRLSRRKLTDLDVRSIVALCSSGLVRQRAVATAFGVSQGCVSMIANGNARKYSW